MKKRITRAGTIVAAVVLGAALVLPSTAALAGEPEGRQHHDSIRITSDAHFDAAHGVRSGSGTAADPYVISGWELHHLELKDTSAHVVITDNTIQGTLILDWAGPGLHVHHNDIGNLLVNRNVRRTGAATSGHISHNTIRTVGQLRHYDGVFSHNVVGQQGSSMWNTLWANRAVNFDGFNGARFTDNVIYGYMDARLHGHHHSSSFDDDSHYHGTQHSHGAEPVDHSQRYHKVLIANNRIYSQHIYSLAYLDTAHSANDRTAASETDSALNAPHVHYTRVSIVGNDLSGGGLWVNVFNAPDRLHTGTATGSLRIMDNDITLEVPQYEQPWRLWNRRHGIYVWQARDVNVSISDNRIAGPTVDELQGKARGLLFDYPAGIALQTLDQATIKIYDNNVASLYYGINASNMNPQTVVWFIRNLQTRDVREDVSYYNSSPPRERP